MEVGHILGRGDRRGGAPRQRQPHHQGETVTGNGSDDNPAYVIKQEDGTVTLKLSRGVDRA